MIFVLLLERVSPQHHHLLQGSPRNLAHVAIPQADLLGPEGTGPARSPRLQAGSGGTAAWNPTAAQSQLVMVQPARIMLLPGQCPRKVSLRFELPFALGSGDLIFPLGFVGGYLH